MSDRPPPPRVMLVAPYVPVPEAHHGGRVTGQLARRLGRHVPVALVHLRAPEEPPLDPETRAVLDAVYEIPFAPRDAGPRPVRVVRTLRALASSRPLRVERLRDPAVASALAAAVRDWRPDVVQFETREIAQYAGAAAGARTVVVDHDPGVDAARAASQRSKRRRALHALDERAWGRFARRVFREADAVVVFTDEDSESVERVAPGVAPHVIPIALDLPPEPLDPAGDGETVLFVGGFEHPPNADAARRLARGIVPRVRDEAPARLELVGRRPTPEVRALERGPGVTVHGDVPDVRPYLDRAAVVALPIRLGGGMRVKALEALAYGKAVVASPLAVQGLDVRDGQELLVREDDDGIAQAVAELLRDAPRRSDLGAAARRWAERSLDWDRAARSYLALYEDLQAVARTEPNVA